MANEAQKSPKYNCIPKQVSRKDFNRYILPHLAKRVKSPKPKLSLDKIFNYILYVLHTGIQWDQLRTRHPELHWSNIYKWHNRWSKDGSYQKLFEAFDILHNNKGVLYLPVFNYQTHVNLAYSMINFRRTFNDA